LVPFTASATWFIGFIRRIGLHLYDLLNVQVFISEAFASGIVLASRYLLLRPS
jgi:hypothetical protein